MEIISANVTRPQTRHPPALAPHANNRKHTSTHTNPDTAVCLFDIFTWLTHLSISSPAPQCVFNQRKSMCVAIPVNPPVYFQLVFALLYWHALYIVFKVLCQMASVCWNKTGRQADSLILMHVIGK